MKKVISIILCLSIITLVSCTDKSAEIYSQNTNTSIEESESVSTVESETSTSENLAEKSETTLLEPPATGLSGTLEIATDFFDDGEFTAPNTVIEGFKKLNPDVEIIINGGDGFLKVPNGYEEGMIIFDSYVQNLRIKMVSGDAPDLIYQSEDDYITDFVPSGLTTDLNSYIESDETFIKDDFFMNVLEANELSGGLYSIIPRFDIEFFRLQVDALDAAQIEESSIETIDYKLLYDIYNKAKDSGKLESPMPIGDSGKVYLMNHEHSAYFDRETMTANFNSEGFIEYLNITDAYNSIDGSIAGGFNDDPSIFEDENFNDIAILATAYPLDSELMIKKSEGFTEPIPVTTSSGELLVSGVSMGIPANAKNPELAWEFIKYCIYESGEIDLSVNKFGDWNGDRFDVSIPINKNNFEEYYRLKLSAYSDEEIDEYISYIYGALELPTVGSLPSEDLELALFYLQEDFYNGLMTAEECAKAMQDRVDIYLAEIA